MNHLCDNAKKVFWSVLETFSKQDFVEASTKLLYILPFLSAD